MRFATAFALLAALATASPVARHNDKKNVCKVAALGTGEDDTPAFDKAVAKCADGGIIELDEHSDYHFITPVKAHGLKNAEVRLQGNMHLPTNMTYVQETVASWELTSDFAYWFDFEGTNVDIVGSKNVSAGWVNAYGQQYYDGNPPNGTGLANRPHLFSFNFTQGTITDLKVLKPPGAIVNLDGEGITVKGSFFDASSSGGFPFNTDGFDVHGHHHIIEDSVIINGDDAVAIQDGAHDILVRRAFLAGPGCHGMSIGSLGKDNTKVVSVSNIHFEDVSLVDALYGARFKSWSGAQGLVTNVTWENFHLHNVSYPIYVTQTYNTQAATQKAGGVGYEVMGGEIVSTGTNSSVEMDGFTWKNFRGTINTANPGDGSCASDPCWYNVPGGDGTQAVVMTCASDTSCRNYKLEDVQVVPQSEAPPSVLCTNVSPESNPAFGIVCQNGQFVTI